MSLEEVGEVRHSHTLVIDWTIPSFSLLCQKKGTRIWSPPFVPCNMNTLFVFVRSMSIDDYIELNFYSKDGKEAPVQCVRFGIEDISNSRFCCCDVKSKKGFSNAGKFKVAKFVRTDFFNQHQHTSFVQGPPRFRLFCEVLDNQICQMINASTQTDNASVTDDVRCVDTDEESEANVKLIEENLNDLKITDDVRCVDTDEESEANVKLIEENLNDLKITDDVRCVDTDEESGENFNLKEENLNDLKSLERLSQNLEQLYIGGEDYDLTIQVQDREFKVHRAVLRARSSVFNAMFTHGLSESSSGVVPIEDSEPAIMEEFLCFVYAGRIRNLSSHNACELYYVADKYDVTDLKEKCISCLKKSLTIETICDIICLATKHNETELLENAILYFAKNMEEILVTVKWQVFLSENPTVANELYIKALKLGFSKRNI